MTGWTRAYQTRKQPSASDVMGATVQRERGGEVMMSVVECAVLLGRVNVTREKIDNSECVTCGQTKPYQPVGPFPVAG